jgi:hypothetical protein
MYIQHLNIRFSGVSSGISGSSGSGASVGGRSSSSKIKIKYDMYYLDSARFENGTRMSAANDGCESLMTFLNNNALGRGAGAGGVGATTAGGDETPASLGGKENQENKDNVNNAKTKENGNQIHTSSFSKPKQVVSLQSSVGTLTLSVAKTTDMMETNNASSVTSSAHQPVSFLTNGMSSMSNSRNGDSMLHSSPGTGISTGLNPSPYSTDGASHLSSLYSPGSSLYSPYSTASGLPAQPSPAFPGTAMASPGFPSSSPVLVSPSDADMGGIIQNGNSKWQLKMRVLVEFESQIGMIIRMTIRMTVRMTVLKYEYLYIKYECEHTYFSMYFLIGLVFSDRKSADCKSSDIVNNNMDFS